MPMTDPLVNAGWLKDHIAAPDIRVVDATVLAPWDDRSGTARQMYEAAHIPGAVYFDIDDIADKDTDLPHMLPDPVKFSAKVRKLGLGDGNRIIVYDANRFLASARVWWMFRTMGHAVVFVLDGGLDAWLQAGGKAEDMPPVPVERHFTPRLRADLIRDAKQMLRAVTDGRELILDARARDRFTGETPEPRPELPSGHIPGSRCLPYGELCTDAGAMKSADEIRAVFSALGISPADVRITTCGSGVTAAILALALARIGYGDVAVYDGSWAEWSRNPKHPVATGAE